MRFFIRELYVTKNRIRYVISPPRPFASSSSPGNESVKDLEDLNSRCIPLNSCHGEFIYINLFYSYSRMFSMVCCAQVDRFSNVAYMKNHGLMSIVLNVHLGVQWHTRMDSRKCFCLSLRCRNILKKWGGRGGGAEVNLIL